jgi:hypothetical protein
MMQKLFCKIRSLREESQADLLLKRGTGFGKGGPKPGTTLFSYFEGFEESVSLSLNEKEHGISRLDIFK